MTDIEIVKQARKHLEKDWHLSLYMVRDLQITKDAELDEMAWRMHRWGFYTRKEIEQDA